MKMPHNWADLDALTTGPPPRTGRLGGRCCRMRGHAQQELTAIRQQLRPPASPGGYASSSRQTNLNIRERLYQMPSHSLLPPTSTPTSLAHDLRFAFGPLPLSVGWNGGFLAWCEHRLGSCAIGSTRFELRKAWWGAATGRMPCRKPLNQKLFGPVFSP